METVAEKMTAQDLVQGLPSRVHAVYARFAQETPDHPAFVEAGRAWSYRHFSDAVEAVARDLRELQVRPGDLVCADEAVSVPALLVPQNDEVAAGRSFACVAPLVLGRATASGSPFSVSPASW